MEQLLTEEICLRPFMTDDAQAFTTAVRESAESVGRWLPWSHPAYTQDEALAWFAHCDAARIRQSAFELGIFSSRDGALIGGIGLRIDTDRWQSDLGYWVRTSRQRRGYASRSVGMLSRFAFRNLDLSKVEIIVAEGNTASAATARRSGAEFEGVAHDRIVLDGQPVAALVFSLKP